MTRHRSSHVHRRLDRDGPTSFSCNLLHITSLANYFTSCRHVANQSRLVQLHGLVVARRPDHFHALSLTASACARSASASNNNGHVPPTWALARSTEQVHRGGTLRTTLFLEGHLAVLRDSAVVYYYRLSPKPCTLVSHLQVRSV